MRVKTFALIGSGWRAGFYIRIANYLKEEYKVTGVLCRSEEKALKIHEEYGVYATTNEEEIRNSHPDFIVVAVTKTSIARVSQYWRDLGFVVLCETPVGMTREDIKLALTPGNGAGRLVVAEQYKFYPTYRKLIETVRSGRLGDILSVHISLAHEYHGISLLRELLMEKPDAEYRLLALHYDLPVTKTKDRYQSYYDGEVVMKKRVIANLEFEDGKIATYDFDSEQYRSTIRHNSIKITGTRGEIINEKLWYLDEENRPVEEQIFENLQDARKTIDENGLSEDEAAIRVLMDMTFLVSLASKAKDATDRMEVISETGEKMSEEDILKWQEKQLQCAIADVTFMLHLQEANGKWIDVRL